MARPGILQSYLCIPSNVFICLPVIKTYEKELAAAGFYALKPLEREDETASSDEVDQVVLGRSGSVLSASTILKSDLFLNLQKMSLPE